MAVRRYIQTDTPLGKDTDQLLRMVIREGLEEAIPYYNQLHGPDGLTAADLKAIHEIVYPNGEYWNPRPAPK